jgi:hypothetical protein
MQQKFRDPTRGKRFGQADQHFPFLLPVAMHAGP